MKDINNNIIFLPNLLFIRGHKLLRQSFVKGRICLESQLNLIIQFNRNFNNIPD